MELKGIKKRAATFKIKSFKNIQFVSGTEDIQFLKGAYLEIKGRFKSLTEDSHDKNISSLVNQIRKSGEKFIKSKPELFKEHLITVEEISGTFKYTGESFTKVELTVFPSRKTNISELTNAMNDLSQFIYDRNIKDNTLFEFNKQIKK